MAAKLKTVPAGARTISFSAKCSDLFGGTLKVGSDEYDLDGYVPYGLGIGGGDYVELEIDLQTGQILNWKAPTDEDLKEAVNGEEWNEDEEDDEEDDEDDWGRRDNRTYFDTVETPPRPYVEPSYEGAKGGATFEDLPERGHIAREYALSLLTFYESNARIQIQERDWIVSRRYQGLEFFVMGPSDDINTPCIIGMHGDRMIWVAHITPTGVTHRVLPQDDDFLELAMVVLRDQNYR